MTLARGNNNGRFDLYHHLTFSVILFRLLPSKQQKRGEGEEDHAAQKTSLRLMVQGEVEYVVVYCIQFLISESREMCPHSLQSSRASPSPALTPSYLVTAMTVNSSRTTSWRRTSIVNSSGITLMTHYDSFIT